MSHGPLRTATDHKNGSEQRYIGGTRERRRANDSGAVEPVYECGLDALEA